MRWARFGTFDVALERLARSRARIEEKLRRTSRVTTQVAGERDAPRDELRVTEPGLEAERERAGTRAASASMEIERLRKLLRDESRARRGLDARLEAAMAQAGQAGEAARAARRELERQTSSIAVRESQLWRLTSEMRRLEEDLEAIGHSRSWRFGHWLATTLRRLTFNPPHGDGAVSAARRRISLLSADGMLDPPRQAAQVEVDPPRATVARSVSPARTPAAVGHEPTPGGAVTVAVAIHNAREDVERCVQSLRRHVSVEHRVLLIDDASTDQGLQHFLQEVAREDGRFEVLSHDVNLGYTRTINEACAVALGDVILLNSDTVVTPRWIENLRQVAYSRRCVATVTAVSNNAGAFSVPVANQDNPLPEGVTVDEMAALVARVSPRRRPEAPTGNGFCMYVRREALESVGDFDADAFPRGYGEENDFCQRARKAGFVNLIDDATFVYHKRSASFGAEKQELIAGARDMLAKRHPRYKPDVTSFLADDPLRDLRASVGSTIDGGSSALRRILASRPTLLIVLHAGKGGTPATNSDLVTSLAATFRCLTLSCDLQRWVLMETTPEREVVERRALEFRRPWRAHEPLDPERRAAFQAICSDERVDLVHLRSFLATGPELVDEAKAAGVPVVCSLHDFFSICPTIQLIDEENRFCGGHCTPGDGPCPTAKRWINDLPPLKHRYVHEWRLRMATHLAQGDAFVSTSDAAREVLTEHFQFMRNGRFHTIEHGRDIGSFRPVSVPPGERPRIVCFGALGVSKGIDLIEALLRVDQEEGRAFEFHFLGDRHTRFVPERFGGVHHGSYLREELPERLADIQPSFAIVASIWPETYCHTLTEAWLAGIPAFASDIGTLRERMRRHGGGWLLDHTDAKAWHAEMRRIAAEPGSWRDARAQIDAMRIRTVDEMAGDYRRLYRGLLAPRP